VFNHLGYDAELVFRDHPDPPGILSRFPGIKGRPPKFFIAGAQKSGTTSLFATLAKHPSIVRPRLKELFFFGNDLRFARGMNFYRSNFRRIGSGKYSIDGSTNSLDHPEAAARIKHVVPDARIIILLRDPAERAYSHYRMQVRNKIEALTFEDALEKENERIEEGKKFSTIHNYCAQRLGYRMRGEYSRMLPPWMKIFGEEQLLIVIAENYFANPKEEYHRILKFLGLQEHTPEQFEIMNAGSGAPMSDKTRKHLQQHYLPYNAQLESLLNVKLNWNEA
jgi:hypothetical protein